VRREEPDPWTSPIPLGEAIELRRWLVEDAETLSAAVADNVEHLRPWMPWVADEPAPIDARRRVLAEWQRAWDAGTDRHLGIFEGDQAIGSIAVMARVGVGAYEIGYWLDHRRTGRGIATLAARCVTTLALTSPGIVRVEIHHDRSNSASAGVPRRLGFTRVDEVAEPANAPGESGVSWIWEMTARRWQL
jgi:ribosomal-protein-serine acetyltransferase